jgi:CheY-like chemotaxis protein
MEAEGGVTILEGAISLVQALAWPLVVLFILIYLGKPLKKFVDNMGEFSVRAGASGLEATARRQQIEAAALLGAASANRASGSTTPPDEASADKIVSAISQATQPSTVQQLSNASVLWVDDRPANNVYERRALEALGIRLTVSTSTEDALEKLRFGRYDAIISDMGRPPDTRAGYTLLDAIRAQNMSVPFIIYAGSNKPEHKEEARRHGALGSTNDPGELFQLVTSAVRTR